MNIRISGIYLSLLIATNSYCPTLAQKPNEKPPQENSEANSTQESINPNLARGKQLYKQKKYKEAKPYLEKAVAEEPKSWQAHFYFAHTMTALGKLSKAKHHYKMSKHVTDHPAVHAHCNKALEKVEIYYTSFKPTKPPESEEKESGPSPEDERKAKIQAKKDKILAEARDRCNKIRKEAEDQIKREKSNSQEIFRYSDGRIGTDISDEREAEIRNAANQRCQQIMKTAESRARGYR